MDFQTGPHAVRVMIIRLLNTSAFFRSLIIPHTQHMFLALSLHLYDISLPAVSHSHSHSH